MAQSNFLLLCAFGSILCAQPHTRPPEPAQAHKRSAGSAAKYSDPEIQARIQAKLSKSKIGRNGFRFSTSAGITTIEGTANVIQHKGAATRLAKSSGARAVVNRIQISEAAKEAARARLATGRRRAQVKRGELRSLPR